MKKIGLLCLALVLALGTMGAGLAYWTETLVIGGTVATGELDAEFSDFNCTPGPYVTCECKLTDTDEDNDNDKATITVGNMYPCGEATCDLTVHNNGTIPLKIVGVVITNPNSADIAVTLTNDPAGKVLDPLGTVTFDLHVHMLDHDGDAGEKVSYSFDATVSIVQFNN